MAVMMPAHLLLLLLLELTKGSKHILLAQIPHHIQDPGNEHKYTDLYKGAQHVPWTLAVTASGKRHLILRVLDARQNPVGEVWACLTNEAVGVPFDQ